jgi:hypothetical protein
MKRKGNLIELAADMDNLRLAFWKSTRGKQGKEEVINYRACLDENLLQLSKNLLEGTCDVGNYHYFTVHEPKERVICASSFNERVMQHALMNVCGKFFDSYQIDDSYACRKDKGQYAALAKAVDNHRSSHWYLKLDVRKFFDTVDHEVMNELIARRIKDKTVLRIFANIVNSYQVLDGKGLPIGNLTSQYFANHYLAASDHFVKETLQVKRYVRYMDDMVLWGDDRRLLLEQGYRLKQFIGDRLLLSLKPFIMNRTVVHLPFLGYRIRPDDLQLTVQSKRRYIRKMRIYHGLLTSGIWDQADFRLHIQPLCSFAEKCGRRGLIKKMTK